MKILKKAHTNYDIPKVENKKLHKIVFKSKTMKKIKTVIAILATGSMTAIFFTFFVSLTIIFLFETLKVSEFGFHSNV